MILSVSRFDFFLNFKFSIKILFNLLVLINDLEEEMILDWWQEKDKQAIYV